MYGSLLLAVCHAIKNIDSPQLELQRRLPLIILLYVKWVRLLNRSIITRHFVCTCVRALGFCEDMCQHLSSSSSSLLLDEEKEEKEEEVVVVVVVVVVVEEEEEEEVM